MGDKKSNMSLVPAKIDDITPEWLSNLLSKKISSKNFNLSGNVHAGTGFLSEMLRISCETIEEKDEKTGSETKPLNLVIKLIPDGLTEGSAQARQFMISDGLDITEMKFYTVVVPELVEQLPQLQNYICPYHIGHVQEDPRSSIIVLEDLKPLGYRTYAFAENISMDKLEDAVKFLAKFHFAASAVELKKGVPLNKVYNFLQWNVDETDSSSSMYDICIEGLGKLDKTFEKHNVSQEMRTAYASLIPKRAQIVQKVYQAQREYPTLIHGDLWANNVLYHETDERPMIAIDWQLLGYGDGLADLAVLIVSSLAPELLNKENSDRLLRLYYDTHSNLCKENGLNVLIRREFEQVSKFYYTYGHGFVLFWFAFASFPFASNYPRLFKIYEFLYKDVDLISFLENL